MSGLLFKRQTGTQSPDVQQRFSPYAFNSEVHHHLFQACKQFWDTSLPFMICSFVVLVVVKSWYQHGMTWAGWAHVLDVDEKIQGKAYLQNQTHRAQGAYV